MLVKGATGHNSCYEFYIYSTGLQYSLDYMHQWHLGLLTNADILCVVAFLMTSSGNNPISFEIKRLGTLFAPVHAFPMIIFALLFSWINQICIVASWCHITAKIWNNIGPGNGLLPDGTKQLTVRMLNYQKWAFGIHLRAILQKYSWYQSVKFVWKWNFTFTVNALTAA